MIGELVLDLVRSQKGSNPPATITMVTNDDSDDVKTLWVIGLDAKHV